MKDDMMNYKRKQFRRGENSEVRVKIRWIRDEWSIRLKNYGYVDRGEDGDDCTNNGE